MSSAGCVVHVFDISALRKGTVESLSINNPNKNKQKQAWLLKSFISAMSQADLSLGHQRSRSSQQSPQEPSQQSGEDRGGTEPTLCSVIPHPGSPDGPCQPQHPADVSRCQQGFPWLPLPGEEQPLGLNRSQGQSHPVQSQEITPAGFVPP